MREIVWADWRDTPELNRALAAFAEGTASLGGPIAPPYTTMGIASDGRIVGAVVFHNWQKDWGVIELSAGSTEKKWLSRDVMNAMFHYCFDRLGAQLALCNVSARNMQDNGRGLHRILREVGFKVYDIERLRGRDENGLIFTLSDDDWRGSRFNTMKGLVHG